MNKSLGKMRWNALLVFFPDEIRAETCIILVSIAVASRHADYRIQMKNEQ